MLGMNSEGLIPVPRLSLRATRKAAGAHLIMFYT